MLAGPSRVLCSSFPFVPIVLNVGETRPQSQIARPGKCTCVHACTLSKVNDIIAFMLDLAYDQSVAVVARVL
uniref:Uncharacterized protein n=1 Tax=Anguilla anguilla TaxID=7936 RepID=A0A0E9PDR9_ANGAN